MRRLNATHSEAPLFFYFLKEKSGILKISTIQYPQLMNEIVAQKREGSNFSPKKQKFK